MPNFSSPFSGLMLNRTLTDSELVRAIRFSIAAEYEAIQLYMQIAESTNNEKAKKLLIDVANEEKEHVGEFLKLLKELQPDEISFYRKGQEEAEVIMQEKKYFLLDQEDEEKIKDELADLRRFTINISKVFKPDKIRTYDKTARILKRKVKPIEPNVAIKKISEVFIKSKNPRLATEISRAYQTGKRVVAEKELQSYVSASFVIITLLRMAIKKEKNFNKLFNETVKNWQDDSRSSSEKVSEIVDKILDYIPMAIAIALGTGTTIAVVYGATVLLSFFLNYFTIFLLVALALASAIVVTGTGHILGRE